MQSPLSDTVFIRVSGDDARSFLHGQVSQDLGAVSEGRAPLTAWHDARGRVKAVLRVLETRHALVLATHASIADSVISGLRLYVLRADVAIERLDEWAGVAIMGAAADLPESVKLGQATNAAVAAGGCCCVRLGPALVHIYGPATVLPAAQNAGDPALAELAEIELGLPAVTETNAGHFLAQMLNLDRLGAVSFTKGCFPGQEVIARTHNLGEIKRRMRRFGTNVSAEPGIGMQVIGSEGVAVGEVVRHARRGERLELLAVVRLSESGESLALDDEDRSPLTELELPYTLR